MLPFTYSYITLFSNLLSFLLSNSLSNISMPSFSTTFFLNGAIGLSIHYPIVGDIDTNWLESLGVGSECCTIAKLASKKSEIVTSCIRALLVS